jgi:hypothetical protein
MVDQKPYEALGARDQRKLDRNEKCRVYYIRQRHRTNRIMPCITHGVTGTQAGWQANKDHISADKEKIERWAEHYRRLHPDWLFRVCAGVGAKGWYDRT